MTPTLTAPAPAPAPLVPAFSPCPFVVNATLRIPAIGNLASFRQWLHSDEFPEKLRVSYLAGVLWLDLTMEQAFSHNDVKTAVASVLCPLARSANLGRFFGDGMRLSHPAVDLSTDPDGMFVCHQSFDTNQVREIAGQHGGVVELEGTPDMVLEVVSESSVEKDTLILPPLYQAAGVREFWRIDARATLNFQIFRLTPGGYVPTQLADGWWRSDVFGRDFCMTAQADPRGRPQFILEPR